VVDAGAAETVTRLQTSGTAADDDDPVRAGWERPLVYRSPSTIPRSRAASIFSIRSITEGRSSRNGST
jgi:hypothetical protein